jgi:hypothetical protein
MSVQRFYGKYRGTVQINIDPNGLGRIIAAVPAVSALLPTSWCLPCYPLAGQQSGAYYVPQIGSAVWIEFEGGDPDYPIWSGCFYGSQSAMPSDASSGNPAMPSIIFQSQLQNRIVISDLPTGGVVLKSTTGASITVNDVGITIDNGKGAKITLIGPNVNINNGALTVV